MALLQYKFDSCTPNYVGAQVLDCTTTQGCRRYCDPDAQRLLVQLTGGQYKAIHLLGNGDYHYLTKLITDSISEPFSLLLFDHHPDMQAPIFEGMLSCGGWLRDMLTFNTLLKHVTIIGINPKLKIETEGFGPKLSVFCEGESFEGCFPVASEGLPLYVSIDKDVLSPCYATTSWDQGSLSLEQMEELLKRFLQGRRLLGVDICGTISFAEGASLDDYALNNRADNYLIELLQKYLENLIV